MKVGSVLATTYAHILGALLIVFLSSKQSLFPNNLLVSIIIAVVTIVLVYILSMLSPGPLKYIIFGIFAFAIGQVLQPVIADAQKKEIVDEILFSITGIFLAMTAVSFWAGDRILGWGMYLFFALVGLLIGRIALVILGVTGGVTGGIDISSLQSTSKLLSWISMIVFSGYIAYDTRFIVSQARRRAKQDYINGSLSIFLDLINLFVSANDLLE